MADYIPFDLQTEILKKLPAKTLMRFRSVSKLYKYLIDSSEFIYDYSFNHTRQRHLLVRSFVDSVSTKKQCVSFVDDDSFPQQKFPFIIPDVPVPPAPRYLPTRSRGTRIIGVFQGLFCLRQTVVVPKPKRFKMNIVLWNPSVRKSVSVVVPDVLFTRRFSFGFGVCSHTIDPKVVKIDYGKVLLDEGIKVCTPWQVEVYTLSSGAWRSIPAFTHPHSSGGLKLVMSRVVINEFIYWLVVDENNHQRKRMIVTFDLTSEKFKDVSLPDSLVSEDAGPVRLSKLQNSLGVLEARIKNEKQCYDVWKMEHGVPNTFTKLFTISLPEVSMIHEVLGFWKNNEPIIGIKSPDKTIQGGVLVQELHFEDVNYLVIYGKGLVYNVRSYTETLLLLDH